MFHFYSSLTNRNDLKTHLKPTSVDSVCLFVSVPQRCSLLGHKLAALDCALWCQFCDCCPQIEMKTSTIHLLLYLAPQASLPLGCFLEYLYKI